MLNLAGGDLERIPTKSFHMLVRSFPEKALIRAPPADYHTCGPAPVACCSAGADLPVARVTRDVAL